MLTGQRVRQQGKAVTSQPSSKVRQLQQWADSHPTTICLLLVAIFMTVVLPGFLALPPFLDERIILTYARQIQNGSGIYNGLADGGKPLMVAATGFAAVIANLPSIAVGAGIPVGTNWLMTGRITVVLAGAAAMVGCFRLGRELWSTRVGVLAGALYMVFPCVHFYDRILVSDTFLSAAGVWVTVLSIRAVRKPKSSSLLLALSIVLALLAKTLPALFFVAFPMWAWMWFLGKGYDTRKSLSRIARSYGILLATVLVFILAMNPERFLGVMQGELRKILGDQFGGKLPALASIPSHFGAYSQRLPEWMSSYLTLPGMALLGAVVVIALARRNRETLFLLASAGAFVAAFLIIPGWLTPRYFVPVVALLSPAFAGTVDWAGGLVWETARNRATLPLPLSAAASRVLAACAVLALLAGMLPPALQFQWLGFRSPEQLPLPAEDRQQYIEEWPSGYGYRDALEWIKADSPRPGQALVVGRYLNSNFEPIARPMGLDVLIVTELRYLGYPKELSDDVRTSFSEKVRDPGRKVYYLESREASDGPAKPQDVVGLKVEPAASFPRPGGRSYVQVYRVKATQAWGESRTVLDFLSEAKNGRLAISAPAGADPAVYVQPKSFTIQGDSRDVLFMQPPSSASTRLQVPEKAKLEFAMALDPAVWDKRGDGVDFQVEVRDGDMTKTVFSAYVDPKDDPSQRRWIDSSVDLGAFAGREVEITLRTLPHASPDYDWAGWATPRIELP